MCKYCLVSIGRTVREMIVAARKEYGPLPVIAAGGVMSSTVIASYLKQREKNVYFAPARYSADNGIGNAYLAYQGVSHGECHHGKCAE